MSQSAALPRRRIGFKAPLTGLVLIALVVYGTWWGWQRAFGDTVDPVAVSTDCPTPTPSATPSTPSATVSTAPAALGSLTAAETLLAAPSGAVTIVLAAATTPPVTPTAPATPLFLAPADVDVNVLNATSRPGLAANTAAVLRDRGFAVGDVGNAAEDDVVPEAAQIRAATVDSPAVRLLIQHVPGAVAVADARADDSVDLVLGELFQSLGDPALVTPVPVPTSSC